MKEKHFPNGFESWRDTYYQVVAEIVIQQTSLYTSDRVIECQEAGGTFSLVELASELTDKFEALNEGREWDGEYFDAVEDFLDKEFNDKN